VLVRFRPGAPSCFALARFAGLRQQKSAKQDAHRSLGAGELPGDALRIFATEPGVVTLRSRARLFPDFRCQTAGHAFTFSRCISPELLMNFAPQKQRARGKPDAGRTRSLVCKIKNTRVNHHRYAGAIRPSPRDGFNGFFRALSGDRAFLPPSPRNAKHCRELTPASRHQDHTTSPSAFSAVRLLGSAASTASRAPRP
jgi:hypothetical protein